MFKYSLNTLTHTPYNCIISSDRFYVKSAWYVYLSLTQSLFHSLRACVCLCVFIYMRMRMHLCVLNIFVLSIWFEWVFCFRLFVFSTRFIFVVEETSISNIKKKLKIIKFKISYFYACLFVFVSFVLLSSSFSTFFLLYVLVFLLLFFWFTRLNNRFQLYL